MNTIINNIKTEFYQFYQDSFPYPSVSVDLEANLPKYSFKVLYPDAFIKIQNLLNQILKAAPSETDTAPITQIQNLAPEFLTANALLLTAYQQCSKKMRELLVEHQFEIVQENEMGIVLTHPTMGNWLIKQNYSHGTTNGKFGLLSKLVTAKNVPVWMFPMELWNNDQLGCQIVSKFANPLRVEMMSRAQTCKEQLKLRHIRVAKEYLFPLEGTLQNDPLYKKYVVVGEKLKLLGEQESLQRLVKLAQENPVKLETILKEICQLTKATNLTDMHMINLRFMSPDAENPDEDTLAIFDGEPIGGLLDVSYGENPFKKLDPGLYSLLGFKKLLTTPALLKEYKFDSIQIESVQRIFDRVINKEVNTIVARRFWHYTKIVVSVICPLIPLILLVVSLAKVLFAVLQQKLSLRTKSGVLAVS